MGIDARQRAWGYTGSQGERLLLLALAEYIPDGKYTCWPSVETLAGMVGVGPRQVQRMVKSLEEAGAITTKEGRGRGHTTLYGILVGLPDDIQSQVMRHVKGDTKDDIAVSPIIQEKGDIKPDIAVSPFPEEKVTFQTEKVTFEGVKGDTAMSPRTMNRNRTEKTRESETRAPPQKTLDFLHEACQIVQQAIGKKLTPAAAAQIASTVTDIPQWTQVTDKWAQRYGTLNIDGMLDWYAHPERMERQNGTHQNGRLPTTRQASPAVRRTRERFDE